MKTTSLSAAGQERPVPHHAAALKTVTRHGQSEPRPDIAAPPRGLDNSGGEWGSRILLVAGIVLVCYLAVKLFRHLVTPALQRISAQTRTMWDDHLFDDKVLHAACRLIPPVLLYLLLPLAFGDDPSLLKLLHKGCSIYLIVVTVALQNTFLSALYDISNKHETLRDRPLKGIYQMLKLVTVSVGIVLIIGILIDRNATSILAGLGASAAVLMLIFKDSILGLVAGVQLSANDMLRPGDWITMSKYGADGYVIEVTLTTVKVQNFDKTITTIPPLCAGQRLVPELAGHARMRRTTHQALGLHRRPHDSPAHAGRDGAAPRKRGILRPIHRRKSSTCKRRGSISRITCATAPTCAAT